MMGISWEPSIYAFVSPDLGLSRSLEWSTDPPTGWTRTKAVRTHEETLQTVMLLHLADICGEAVQLVGMAGDSWGGADIIGLDRLGRVHLFELKRERIGAAAAQQLAHYLLSLIFVDPVQHVCLRWVRTTEWELQDWRLAETLAGALAGQQTYNLGHAFVQKWKLCPDVPRSRWKKWDEAQKHPFRLAALLKKAGSHLDKVPAPEAMLQLAREWRQRLRPQESPPTGLFACERPVVIWLVGSGFNSEAEEEIRGWRAAGVDARCLQAEVRFSSQREGLILRIGREVAPGRAELVRRVEDWAAGHVPLGAQPRLDLDLYTRSRPSDRSNTRAQAGLLKSKLKATIHLDGKERIEIVMAED